MITETTETEKLEKELSKGYTGIDGMLVTRRGYNSFNIVKLPNSFGGQLEGISLKYDNLIKLGALAEFAKALQAKSAAEDTLSWSYPSFVEEAAETLACPKDTVLNKF